MQKRISERGIKTTLVRGRRVEKSDVALSAPHNTTPDAAIGIVFWPGDARPIFPTIRNLKSRRVQGLIRRERVVVGVGRRWRAMAGGCREELPDEEEKERRIDEKIPSEVLFLHERARGESNSVDKKAERGE